MPVSTEFSMEMAEAMAKFYLVIPFYRADSAVQWTLERLTAWHRGPGKDFQVLLVDDGSGDSTPRRLLEFSQKHADWCQALPLARHQGKGGALRDAFRAVCAEAEFGVFTDCDLHYGLDIVNERMVPELSSCDIVIADRSWVRDACHAHFVRRLASGVFNRLVSLTTGVNYRDTQAGLKGFRLQSCRSLWELLTLRNFAFDVELLSVASYYRLKIVQIPVGFKGRWAQSNHRSTVNMLLSSLTMLWSLFLINFNWKSGRYRCAELEQRIERDAYCVRRS
jgi:dolichyl-phosphate beta-glucosyltransferase